MVYLHDFYSASALLAMQAFALRAMQTAVLARAILCVRPFFRAFVTF